MDLISRRNGQPLASASRFCWLAPRSWGGCTHPASVRIKIETTTRAGVFMSELLAPNESKLSDGGRKDEPKTTGVPPPFAGARG